MEWHLINIIFFIVVPCFALGVFLYGFYATSQRRKALFAWSITKGLTLSYAKDYDFDNQFSNFSCLQKGHDRYADNIMRGNIAGREVLCCDYHYKVSSGKSDRRYDFSLIIVKSPFLLKPLVIRPENFLDKLAGLVGFDDINFESAEFSRKFFVKSPDKKWAYDIIHPQMMEYFLSAPVFSVQFDLCFIIVYRDQIFSAEEFDSAIDFVNGIFDRIPDYVVQSQKSLI